MGLNQVIEGLVLLFVGGGAAIISWEFIPTLLNFFTDDFMRTVLWGAYIFVVLILVLIGPIRMLMPQGADA